ncbi:TonB-dependent receptor plug domain-containing protein [Steroidobacter cummioxidans]|uniref:TonB-dependent receptor plug domain-containing protein n=1 Tax=Steroidobacter cummioxidans TaxID=1803913 RepID=UPI000E3124CE|nr:TonB-dependent receptor [Steroidobacter cummioxidans]
MRTRYSLKHRGSLLGAAVAGVLSSVAVTAQAQDNLETVVVLGTYSSDTTALTSTAPIDVLKGEELQKSGATTLNQALWQLVPSFNFPQNQPTTRGQNPKGASLRGLSTDQTLVLINGKRRHASSIVQISSGLGLGAQPVDLDAIPFSAIERIEVLRDGASAQYGSDAIAGVINIVLKSSTATDFNVQVGQFSQGDGLRRSVGSSTGFELPGDGFLTASVDVIDYDPTDNSRPDLAAHYFDGDPREATVNRQHKVGSPERTRINVALNGEADVSENVRAYGFATYGNSDSRNNVIGVLYPRSDWTVRAIYPDGSHPWYKYRNEDISGTFGARFGNDSLGHFDLSAGYGRDDHDEHIYDSINPSFGLDSPTSFLVASLKNEQTNVALDYRREFAVSAFHGPLTLSSGIAYRHEEYTLGAGDYESYADGGVPILDGPNAGRRANTGAFQGQGMRPLDAGTFTRDVRSAYVGFEAQFTSKLKLGITGRAEDYSDFGSATNAKLSGRYEITPAIALRATIGTGYRAPSLGQIGTSWTTSTGTVLAADGTPALTRILPVNDPVAQALGARRLTPEESTDINVGFVIRPNSSFSITADAYQIEVDDRITLSERLSGATVQSVLNAAGYWNYAAAQFFTNAADTRTRGFDVASRYFAELAGGKLELSASYAKYKTEVTDVEASPFGFDVFGRSQRIFMERGNPESRLLLGARYSLGAWSVFLAESRFGTYISPHATTPSLDQTYSALWKTDIDISYRPNQKFSINVGLENALDERPDRVIDPAARVQYGNSVAVAPEGAFWYSRLAYSF